MYIADIVAMYRPHMHMTTKKLLLEESQDLLLL